jgi:putative hydrolase of the HAD superfamily
VRAVFFDAGGTLIHIDYPRVALAIKRMLGREVAPEAFIAAEYAGRDAVEAHMAASDASTDTSRWAVHFRAMLGALGLSEADYALVAPAVMAAHRERHLWTGVVPGTADALAALRQAGYLVAVVSNADGTVETLLQAAGLREHLAFVVDSGIVKIEKPDPRIFELALCQAGVGADESYYVGDIHPIDVVGARAAGLTPVLLDPLGRYADRGCRTAPDVPAFCRELVSARRAA